MPTRWLAILLPIVTLAAYWPVFRAGYVWDDDNYVTANRTLRSVDGLTAIWTDPGATPQYYPLVHTTFWVEYRLWGLHPLGYHLVNVLLHAATALLVWRVLVRLGVPGAMGAAWLFALHPVHVESVAWVTERKNVLSGLFYVSAFLCYLRFASIAPRDDDSVEAEGSGGWRWYGLVMLMYVAALLSKTVTVTLPAALLLVVWWRGRRPSVRDALPLLPMLLIGLPLALGTVHLEKVHVGASGSAWDLSFAERVLIAGRAIWFYLGKLACPVGLSFVYRRWDLDSASALQWLAPTAVVLATLWLARRRRFTGPLVAWLFFIGTLFPALGFFDIYPMQYTFVADHYVYLASLGPIALVCAWLARRCGNWGPPRTAVVAVMLLLAILTSRRAMQFESRSTLWQATLTRDPGSPIANLNLGNVLKDEGRVYEALEHYERVLEREPKDPMARVNMAIIWSWMKADGRAVAMFEEVLADNPDLELAHYNFATLHDDAGRTELAEHHYRETLRINPRNPAAANNLGLLAYARGDEEVAFEWFERALESEPDFVLALVNRGRLQLERGDVAAARRSFERALAVSPNHPDVLRSLEEIEGR